MVAAYKGEFDPVASFKTISSAPPAFSMRGRTIYGNWENSFYEVYGQTQFSGDLSREVGAVKNAAPKWSMHSKAPNFPQKNTPPGPGNYYINGVVSTSHPSLTTGSAWKFGSADRDKAAGRIMLPSTPSPTDYQEMPEGLRGLATQENSQSYSMGAKCQDQADPEYRETHSPRPSVHTFEVNTESLNATKSAAPRWSMRPRTPMRDPPSPPGPGTYEAQGVVSQEHPTKDTAPRYGFGSTHRDKVCGRIMYPRTPSPNEYQSVEQGAIGRSNQEKPPSYSMGSRCLDQNDPEYRATVSPRPSVNAYEVKTEHLNATKKAAPKWTMRSKSSSPMPRKRDYQPLDTPGPGAYSIQGTVGRSTSPSSRYVKSGGGWNFGSSKRFSSPKPDERIYSY